MSPPALTLGMSRRNELATQSGSPPARPMTGSASGPTAPAWLRIWVKASWTELKVPAAVTMRSSESPWRPVLLSLMVTLAPDTCRFISRLFLAVASSIVDAAGEGKGGEGGEGKKVRTKKERAPRQGGGSMGKEQTKE